MKKCTLKILTENAWILFVNGERIGIVSKQPDHTVSIIGKVTISYQSMQEFQKEYNIQVIEPAHEAELESEQSKIEQIPIKHSTFYNVEKKPIVTYTRSEKSNSRYAAGYFAVKNSTTWKANFCPKLSTLEEHEYVGPFLSKMEVNQQISSKNKNTNILKGIS